MFRCFFFFKQKTAYEMRISDWSSDVCSSDLLTRNFAILSAVTIVAAAALLTYVQRNLMAVQIRQISEDYNAYFARAFTNNIWDSAQALIAKASSVGKDSLPEDPDYLFQIGRASCRERVCQYV